jgi:transcriptional regulator with XRE-family HTH domain
MNESNISRLERFEINYTQETLELFADAYGCDPADLLRPPPSEQKPESEFERYRRTLSDAQKLQAVAVLKAMFTKVA